jgi:NADPH:quinone reductase-like Zn-dependent oxidoreductase
LVIAANLTKGEHVLIHSATGGVGLAAVYIAHMRGAIVHATAGTEEKRAWLKAQGVVSVHDSRTLNFAEEVREATQGRGVDVVLNSLAGPAQEASINVLAAGGRFVELGMLITPKHVLSPFFVYTIPCCLWGKKNYVLIMLLIRQTRHSFQQ